MLSDKSYARMQALQEKIEEVMKVFKIPRDEAFLLVCANGSYKAAEVAERIERRQQRAAEAELRSLSARASTYKANMAEEAKE